jgi:condensin complex subunit 2
MAPARRAANSRPLIDDSDSDASIDQPTPKPRQHIKKRLSEVYNPENDQSFSSDPGRVPLRSVNINDDAAEKRRRRKSTKFAAPENAQAGASSQGNGEGDGAETSRTMKQMQQLTSVAQPPVINVPLDVMSSNFEEWMKMATDNVHKSPRSTSFLLILHIENQCSEFMEFRSD